MQVILLPGLDGTGSLFVDLIKSLSNTVGIKVVSLNQLSGNSYKEQAQEIARELTGKKFLLVAESYSGRLGYELCSILKGQLQGVVFIASFIDSPSRLSRLARFIPAFALSPNTVSKWLLKRVGFAGHASDSLINQTFQSITSADKTKLQARLRNISLLQSPAIPFDIPTMYIRPSKDHLVSPQAVQSVRLCFPALKVIDIDGGHFIAQSRPNECAKIIQLTLADTQHSKTL